MKMKLLKNYKGRKEGSIISVQSTLVKTLIDNGIAYPLKQGYSNTALASPADKMMRSKEIK